MNISRTLFPHSLFLLLCATPYTAAYAGGFGLIDMSASSLGNAHAGGAAIAEDVGTVYYNPAGLMRLPGRQFMIAGTGIRPSAKFENQGSVTAGGALSGGNGGDAGDLAPVPGLFYAMDVAPNLRFGLGVHVPFGLKTDYDDGWVGRYHALKSELKTININPVLAYRISDAVYIGGGLSAQYADVNISSAIDFGTVCVGALTVANCAPIGFLPQQKDGSVKIDGTDWGYGFNLGAMFTPSANVRFGITYRSKISHELSGGNARFTKPAGLPAPLAASPSFTDGGVKANVDLPELVNLSGYADIDSVWSVMGDINWTRWSRFEELRIRFDNGAADSVTPEKWRDTWRISAAVNYRYNDEWKLRGGIAYDQTPVKDEFRTPRIPDNDRTWLAVGAQYKTSKQSAWDFGYAHLVVKDPTLNKSEPGRGTLVGKYSNDVNLFSAQYNHVF
ncbi:MAG: outer membrane protein transport protein [Burkholderiales bacterium]